MDTKIVEYVNITIKAKVTRDKKEGNSATTHGFVYSEVSDMIETLVDMPGEVLLVGVVIEVDQDEYDTECANSDEEDEEDEEEGEDY